MGCGKLFENYAIKTLFSGILYLNNSMDTKFQSSFIPKQPVNQSSRHVSGSNIFFLISFLIFVVGMVGAGAVYLWDKQMDAKIASVNENLSKARNSFDQNTVKEFSRLNDKINASDALLKQHVAPSVLFKVIGDTTLQNARFADFKYTNAGADKISVSMNGEAVSYEAVALQASAFTNPKLRNVFRSPIFSDPNLDNNGVATFSFTTGIDPTLLNYYKLQSDPNNQVFKSAGLNPQAATTSNTSAATNSNTVTVDPNTDQAQNSNPAGGQGQANGQAGGQGQAGNTQVDNSAVNVNGQ